MVSKWHMVIFLVFFVWWSSNVHCQTNIFRVVESGAISDAQTDNKQAFLYGWKKACAANGGTLVIERGVYVVSDVEFLGPCIGQTNVVVTGTLMATEVPKNPNIDYWIIFRNLNMLSISGHGTLDGNGAAYWQRRRNKNGGGDDKQTITSMKLDSVKNAAIQDITSINSKKFHLNIHESENVTITNVHLTAPSDSPNTDGIHVGDSNNVRIRGANIATGDDCISLGDGATNINVTGVNCGPGHGISIGSLGKYPGEKEVRYVRVSNCSLTNTTNGLRIKTFGPSTPGVASDITFQGIIVNNVKNPIIIDQHYCPHSECQGQGQGQGQGESSVSINGVKFIDVHGSSSEVVGVKIACSKNTPCKGIELSGVQLTYNGKPTTANCSSADVKFLGPNQLPSRCSLNRSINHL